MSGSSRRGERPRARDRVDDPAGLAPPGRSGAPATPRRSPRAPGGTTACRATAPSGSTCRRRTGSPSGREERRQRPTALAGHRLDGVHVDRVEVGPLLAVDLDRDEVRVQERRRSPRPRRTPAPSRGTSDTPRSRSRGRSGGPRPRTSPAPRRPTGTSPRGCPRAVGGTGSLPRPDGSPAQCPAADRLAAQFPPSAADASARDERDPGPRRGGACRPGAGFAARAPPAPGSRGARDPSPPAPRRSMRSPRRAADIVVVDLDRTDEQGIALVAALRDGSDARVMAATRHVASPFVELALAAGACGVLPSDRDPAQLLERVPSGAGRRAGLAGGRSSVAGRSPLAGTGAPERARARRDADRPGARDPRGARRRRDDRRDRAGARRSARRRCRRTSGTS